MTRRVQDIAAHAAAGPWAYNPIGSVHGGWYAAVLDAPLGCAAHATSTCLILDRETGG